MTCKKSRKFCFFRYFFGAMTCKKSRKFCFFRYLMYRFENFSSSEDTATVTLFLSLVILISSPRLPVLPFTLIRSWKYFSSCATSMILSSHGCWQSTQYFDTVFFTSPFFAPLTPLGPFFAPFTLFLATTIVAKKEADATDRAL